MGRASDPSIISITHIICHHLYLYFSLALLFITISICHCHWFHQYSSSVSFKCIGKNTDIFLLQIHCLWGNSLSSMFFHSPVCGKTQAIASLWQMWSWLGGCPNIANACAEIFANIYRPSLIPASVLIFVMGWPPSSEPLSPPNQVNNRQSLQLTNEISYQLSNITSSVNWPTQKCNQLINRISTWIWNKFT